MTILTRLKSAGPFVIIPIIAVMAFVIVLSCVTFMALVGSDVVGG